MLHTNFKFIIVYNILTKRKKKIYCHFYPFICTVAKIIEYAVKKERKELMTTSLLFCLHPESGINKCCSEESLSKVVVNRTNRW